MGTIRIEGAAACAPGKSTGCQESKKALCENGQDGKRFERLAVALTCPAFTEGPRYGDLLCVLTILPYLSAGCQPAMILYHIELPNFCGS